MIGSMGACAYGFAPMSAFGDASAVNLAQQHALIDSAANISWSSEGATIEQAAPSGLIQQITDFFSRPQTQAAVQQVMTTYGPMAQGVAEQMVSNAANPKKLDRLMKKLQRKMRAYSRAKRPVRRQKLAAQIQTLRAEIMEIQGAQSAGLVALQQPLPASTYAAGMSANLVPALLIGGALLVTVIIVATVSRGRR